MADDATPGSAGLPASGLHRHPGDGWIVCGQGHRHWGLHGAAGLLVARRTADGRPDAVVLQHRALWSDQGGTWGVPGGARAPGEDAVEAALREAAEEAGIDRGAVRITGTSVLDHGGWTYTTVLAEALTAFTPAATDQESLDVAWVPVADVAALPLLPAFGEAWPGLRARFDADGGTRVRGGGRR